MAPSVALVKIASNTVLPIRIFVNRKQLLQNNSKDTVFHAPLLSNNSIVCIKSPSTRIYLSNNDMHNLTSEIKTDILLILYELGSPLTLQDVLKKLKMGHSADWQKDVVPKLFQKSSEALVASHLQSITRISKFKYKLHFKYHWELDIFIENIRVLARIRAYLIFKNELSICPPMAVHSKRKILLNEQVETPPTLLNEEDSNMPDREGLEEEDKPKLKFKYRPITNLGECINIHVLQRPQRHKKPLVESR